MRVCQSIAAIALASIWTEVKRINVCQSIAALAFISTIGFFSAYVRILKRPQEDIADGMSSEDFIGTAATLKPKQLIIEAPRLRGNEQFVWTSNLAKEYCSQVDDDSDVWTKDMVASEYNVLIALNEVRKDPSGNSCGVLSKAPPLQANRALRCAARIQAKNIVDDAIEFDGYAEDLHSACPSRKSAICEDMVERIKHSGYDLNGRTVAYVGEVLAGAFHNHTAVVNAWKMSPNHCKTILKNGDDDSKELLVDVGIGYYEDPKTGKSAHAVLVAQRNFKQTAKVEPKLFV